MKKIAVSLTTLAALLVLTLGASFAGSKDCCPGGTCCKGGECCRSVRGRETAIAETELSRSITDW
jgi:hypothetical protein